MKDVVVIPTYNERENIASLLDAIFARHPGIHVVVVDDSSPDGTAALVKEKTKSYPTLTLKSRPGKLGLSTAYLDTFRELLTSNHDIRSIITMDADHSHDPSVIATFLAHTDEHDIVIGSRYVEGGRLENWPVGRKILSHAGNLYARITSGTGIRDLTAGYQCFRAELLRDPAFQRMTATGFAFQMEMKIIAYLRNARIKEVPITFTNRKRGKSKLMGQLTSFVYEGLVMPWRLRLIHRNLAKRQVHTP